MAKIIIIGSGFSGLSAAAYLSRAGHQVEVFEKNSTGGGRARQFSTDEGYVFDMGPSWYWMPEVFEDFFSDFGYSVDDLYKLDLLDPAFEMVFDKSESLNIPHDYQELRLLFESVEKGSAEKLDRFMEEAEYKYRTGMGNLSNMPGLSFTEFAQPDLIKGVLRLQVFSSFSQHVRNYFSHPRLLALMEFPVLFLGAMPRETPALYSLMNYAGLKLGTWYPQGGFGKVVEGMLRVCEENGCKFHFNAPVERVLVKDGLAKGVIVNGKEVSCDAVIASADYQHVEEKLLPENFRNYNNAYWQKKTFAPSSLIYYLGLKKELRQLKHHTLFFEENFLQHSIDIYKQPKWPQKPLFYVCCPSRTDKSVAPEGHENLFLLMPLAPGIEDTPQLREKYFQLMMARLEKKVGEPLLEHIDFKKSYCINDFINDYNSYKGNAYGLANTLRQTAIMKPRIRNKKLPNLFYTGQLTVPGPGVPPSLISGKIVAHQLMKTLKTSTYEKAV